MTQRRTFLAGAAATLAVGGCFGPTGPGTLTVRTEGESGMNRGETGDDLSVVVSVLQLTSSAEFDTADVYELQDPDAVLGATLLQKDRIVVRPGESSSTPIPLAENVAVIGVVAGFVDINKTFRATTAAPAKGDAGLIVSVTEAGITLTGV